MKKNDDDCYEKLTFSDNAVRGLHPLIKARKKTPPVSRPRGEIYLYFKKLLDNNRILPSLQIISDNLNHIRSRSNTWWELDLDNTLSY